MLENCVFPQIFAEIDGLMFQQDGTALLWTNDFLLNGLAWKGGSLGPHGVLI
jgi:hypothetical protein